MRKLIATGLTALVLFSAGCDGKREIRPHSDDQYKPKYSESQDREKLGDVTPPQMFEYFMEKENQDRSH